MKTKEILYLLGFRPKAEKYGFELSSFNLPKDGHIDYAKWLHPKSYAVEFDQKEVDTLRRFVPPGSVAIDVGAHTGDTTLPLGLAAGPEGCVFAFEPNPNTFAVLQENAKLNTSKMRIVPSMCAATEEDGPIEFEYSDPGFCNGGRHQGVSRWIHGHAFRLQVEGRNIERMLRSDYPDLISKISYIKTDAEGYDGFVVKSMRGLIEETRPYVQSEMYKHMPTDQRVDLVNLLEGMDYHVAMHGCGYDPGSGPRVTADGVDRWKNYDIFAVPREKMAELQIPMAA